VDDANATYQERADEAAIEERKEAEAKKEEEDAKKAAKKGGKGMNLESTYNSTNSIHNFSIWGSLYQSIRLDYYGEVYINLHHVCRM
jgi:hypothetical protein